MNMTISEEIQVKASMKDTFAFLIDPESKKNIIPLLEEVIFLDVEPLQVGSKYIEVSTIAGRRFETTYMVVVLRENAQISVVTTQSLFPIRVDLKLFEGETQTTILLTLTLQLKGIFLLGSSVIRTIATQQAGDILYKTKKLLEQ